MKSFITADEFLNQSEKVQKVLIDWWKPQWHDLCFDKVKEEYRIIDSKYGILKKRYAIPCFQMHHLMEFIRETGYKHIGINNCINKNQWNVKAFKNMMQFEPDIEVEDESLIKALWQIVCIIAKQS